MPNSVNPNITPAPPASPSFAAFAGSPDSFNPAFPAASPSSSASPSSATAAAATAAATAGVWGGLGSPTRAVAGMTTIDSQLTWANSAAASVAIPADSAATNAAAVVSSSSSSGASVGAHIARSAPSWSAFEESNYSATSPPPPPVAAVVAAVGAPGVLMGSSEVSPSESGIGKTGHASSAGGATAPGADWEASFPDPTQAADVSVVVATPSLAETTSEGTGRTETTEDSPAVVAAEAMPVLAGASLTAGDVYTADVNSTSSWKPVFPAQEVDTTLPPPPLPPLPGRAIDTISDASVATRSGSAVAFTPIVTTNAAVTPDWQASFPTLEAGQAPVQEHSTSVTVASPQTSFSEGVSGTSIAHDLDPQDPQPSTEPVVSPVQVEPPAELANAVVTAPDVEPQDPSDSKGLVATAVTTVPDTDPQGAAESEGLVEISLLVEELTTAVASAPDLDPQVSANSSEIIVTPVQVEPEGLAITVAISPGLDPQDPTESPEVIGPSVQVEPGESVTTVAFSPSKETVGIETAAVAAAATAADAAGVTVFPVVSKSPGPTTVNVGRPPVLSMSPSSPGNGPEDVIGNVESKEVEAVEEPQLGAHSFAPPRRPELGSGSSNESNASEEELDIMPDPNSLDETSSVILTDDNGSADVRTVGSEGEQPRPRDNDGGAGEPSPSPATRPEIVRSRSFSTANSELSAAEGRTPPPLVHVPVTLHVNISPIRNDLFNDESAEGENGGRSAGEQQYEATMATSLAANSAIGATLEVPRDSVGLNSRTTAAVPSPMTDPSATRQHPESPQRTETSRQEAENSQQSESPQDTALYPELQQTAARAENVSAGSSATAGARAVQPVEGERALTPPRVEVVERVVVLAGPETILSPGEAATAQVISPLLSSNARFISLPSWPNPTAGALRTISLADLWEGGQTTRCDGVLVRRCVEGYGVCTIVAEGLADTLNVSREDFSSWLIHVG